MEGNQREREFSHWLCNIEGIGRLTARKLLRMAGSAQGVYEMREEELAKVLSQEQLKRFLEARRAGGVAEAYRELERKGIRHYPASDPLYPSRLLEIPDRPEGLYVKGNLPEEAVPAVALIGARVCSEYGAYLARRFAAAFAEAGVNVISGLARGIDGIGQRSALDHGGATYGVLGCGPDICYPEENRDIYERLAKAGGILSEYPPGTRPRSGLFPQRNRIISGLADAVVVIEAREKSGTFITVDMALEQGREVFAVPGRVTDRLSSGCNRLIRQGAGMALSPDDVLEELARRRMEFAKQGKGAEPSMDTQENERGRKETNRDARPAEETGYVRHILDCLDFLPLSAGQIQERMAAKGICLPLPVLMQELLELSLEGRCGQDGGYYYRI